jgi:hypothetical protein
MSVRQLCGHFSPLPSVLIEQAQYESVLRLCPITVLVGRIVLVDPSLLDLLYRFCRDKLCDLTPVLS